MGADQLERRGRVHHILSGEHYHFRDWATLVSYLDAKLQELEEGNRPQNSVE